MAERYVATHQIQDAFATVLVLEDLLDQKQCELHSLYVDFPYSARF